MQKKFILQSGASLELRPYARALPGSIPRCPLYHDSKEGWAYVHGVPGKRTLSGGRSSDRAHKKNRLQAVF